MWESMQPKAVKSSVMTAWTSYEFKKCKPLVEICFEGLRDVSLQLAWAKFQNHALHVVPSIGPTVLDVDLHGQQTLSRKAG